MNAAPARPLPVRVLIVDDSASMRAALKRILSSDPDIEVVGMAPEPNVAREMIKELLPDVLTLDIEMPGMDGLSFLERIMRLRPMPVVMCSTLTARGTEATIEALRLGAVDCIAKPTGDPLQIERDAARLCATVKAAGRSTARRSDDLVAPVKQLPSGGMRDVVIAIGASTGGVEALFTVLKTLPSDCPPVLVVQHMPASFTGSFAARLNKECALTVSEALDGTPIARGCVYIAPGGQTHMELAGGVPWTDQAVHECSRQRTSAIGRCVVPVGRDVRFQCRRRHADRHGLGRCRGFARDAPSGCSHHWSERRDLCRLRNAARGLRSGSGGA